MARAFKLLAKIHFGIATRLLHVSIGARLLALMALAASVAILMAFAGVNGLSASKDSLRSVYEDRMVPVTQLAEIGSLMLSNRLLLQGALSEVSITAQPGQPALLALDGDAAVAAARAMEANIRTINNLWERYSAAPHSEAERSLANQFAQSRGAFVTEALLPAIAALRANDYPATRQLARKAQTLYERAGPDLQALCRLQFAVAHDAYHAGVERFENTRALAIGVVGAGIFVMGWLGLVLGASIVRPLRRIIAIFEKIAEGQYTARIRVQGCDEISQVMRALAHMQAKLVAHEDAIHQLAFYDPLTKLPNRRLLRDRMQQALSAGSRNPLFGAVMMIDLDDFKSINDSRGHDVGDLLLVEIAQRIQSRVRQVDTVVRLGGDEFVVTLLYLSADEAQAAMQAELVGQDILAVIQQPYLLADQVHHPSASMGVCLFSDQSTSFDELLKRADSAMYQAKRGGRNALQFYDPQIQASLEKRVAMESELRNALARQQLQLYYQIQVDNHHRVMGAEVLLRWVHPVHGLVLPDQFIPIAEESGLIVPIGEWVLRTACEQLGVWAQNPATEGLMLAVNVSARQFRQPNFVGVVDAVLAQTGINPQRLKLELTESLVLHNIHDTIDKMKTLSRKGIHFSMDDFGTGYSSLAHLTKLPIQQLKIDKSFVRSITTNHNDAVIVQTIIGMANNLGVAVIGEGVETQEQRTCLERFGCMAYQGYLYGKPMLLQEFEALALGALAV